MIEENKSFSLTIADYPPDVPFWPRFYASQIKPVLPRMVLSIVLTILVVSIGLLREPMLAAVGATVFLLVVVVWTKGYFKHKAFFDLLRRTTTKRDIHLNFDEEGFIVDGEDKESKIPWKEVTRSVRTIDYFVLLAGRTTLVLIPASQITEDQMDFCNAKIDGRS